MSPPQMTARILAREPKTITWIPQKCGTPNGLIALTPRPTVPQSSYCCIVTAHIQTHTDTDTHTHTHTIFTHTHTHTPYTETHVTQTHDAPYPHAHTHTHTHTRHTDTQTARQAHDPTRGRRQARRSKRSPSRSWCFAAWAGGWDP